MIKAVIFDFYRTVFDPETGGLNPGALETLKELKRKYKLFLISSGAEERKKLIDSYNLKRFFTKILVVGKEKQKADFVYCTEEAGCRLEEVIVVGDALRSEIALGRSLGMKTVRFKRGIFSREKPVNKNKPDYEIKSLLELPDLIVRIRKEVREKCEMKK